MIKWLKHNLPIQISPETDFNLLEDSEDADNHTSSSTATRLSLQFQLDETYLGQRIDQVAATIWSDFS